MDGTAALGHWRRTLATNRLDWLRIKPTLDYVIVHPLFAVKYHCALNATNSA